MLGTAGGPKHTKVKWVYNGHPSNAFRIQRIVALVFFLQKMTSTHHKWASKSSVPSPVHLLHEWHDLHWQLMCYNSRASNYWGACGLSEGQIHSQLGSFYSVLENLGCVTFFLWPTVALALKKGRVYGEASRNHTPMSIYSANLQYTTFSKDFMKLKCTNDTYFFTQSWPGCGQM